MVCLLCYYALATLRGIQLACRLTTGMYITNYSISSLCFDICSCKCICTLHRPWRLLPACRLNIYMLHHSKVSIPGTICRYCLYRHCPYSHIITTSSSLTISCADCLCVSGWCLRVGKRGRKRMQTCHRLLLSCVHAHINATTIPQNIRQY